MGNRFTDAELRRLKTLGAAIRKAREAQGQDIKPLTERLGRVPGTNRWIIGRGTWSEIEDGAPAVRRASTWNAVERALGFQPGSITHFLRHGGTPPTPRQEWSQSGPRADAVTLEVQSLADWQAVGRITAEESD